MLVSILKLLSPEETFNFGGSLEHFENTAIDPDFFQEKGVIELNTTGIDWLQLYCPRFDTLEKLAHLPRLSTSLKLNLRQSIMRT